MTCQQLSIKHHFTWFIRAFILLVNWVILLDFLLDHTRIILNIIYEVLGLLQIVIQLFLLKKRSRFLIIVLNDHCLRLPPFLILIEVIICLILQGIVVSFWLGSCSHFRLQLSILTLIVIILHKLVIDSNYIPDIMGHPFSVKKLEIIDIIG